MHRISHLLGDARSLVIPYWRSEEKWRAYGLLAAIVLLNLVLVGTAVLLTYWQRAFYNALEAKDWDGFVALLVWWRWRDEDGFMPSFLLIGAIAVPVSAYALYLRQALQIRWRRWLTNRFLEDWLSDRAYYRIALADTGIDNPDQRIAEDVRLLVDNTLILGIGLLKAVVSLLSFVFLLWSLSDSVVVFGTVIPGYLVWAALLYAGIGTLVTHLVGQKLITFGFQQQKVEADFRFGLMRCSENAEGIALYGGEKGEKRELGNRFAMIVDNWMAIMRVTKNLTLFTTAFGQIALVFPFAVVAPAYFMGRMPLGGVFQTGSAFVQVQMALSWLVDNYAAFTAWGATVERMAGFRRSVDTARAATDGPSVAAGDRDEVRLANLSLSLPSGQRLLHVDELRVGRGQRILVSGPSGMGKSTLLRAIVGIWPYGSGSVRLPKGRLMFMPQRPYLPLGTLKQVACYPENEADFTDAQVAKALQAAGLGPFATHLHEVEPWTRQLSGGEQQRIALTRALLLKPDWLFMDEATANLDPAAEEHFYRRLADQLPAATVVSISHGESVAKFHTSFLSIEGGRLHLQAS